MSNGMWLTHYKNNPSAATALTVSSAVMPNRIWITKCWYTLGLKCPDSLSRVHNYRGPESVPAVMSREAAGYKPGSSSPERISNYRLSRARRIIENVFGVLSSKCRVLVKTRALHPKKVGSVVLSHIYLHNFLHSNVVSTRHQTRLTQKFRMEIEILICGDQI